MYQQTATNLPGASAQIMMNASDIDTFITPDPTPKSVSRRQWRRRRIRRGKT